MARNHACRIVNAIIYCIVIAALTCCAKAPITGRSQLILIPPEVEKQLALKSEAELLKKERLSQNKEFKAIVNKVGRAITQNINDPSFDWNFYIIQNDNIINAFCLPGGKVFVYTGILRLAKDECGLATVIGHEIAHALARHGAERMTLALISKAGGAAISSALGIDDPNTIKTFKTVYGLASSVGLILPYSRKQELEADHIGLILMAKAGYDPRCAVDFWEKMKTSAEKSRGNTPPPFLSTHPTDDTRIREIKRIMPEALKFYLTPKS